MKKKLKLDQLKVESFVTSLSEEDAQIAKGGEVALSNTLCICVTRSNGCITFLSTCLPATKPL